MNHKSILINFIDQSSYFEILAMGITLLASVVPIVIAVGVRPQVTSVVPIVIAVGARPQVTLELTVVELVIKSHLVPLDLGEATIGASGFKGSPHSSKDEGFLKSVFGKIAKRRGAR